MASTTWTTIDSNTPDPDWRWTPFWHVNADGSPVVPEDDTPQKQVRIMAQIALSPDAVVSSKELVTRFFRVGVSEPHDTVPAELAAQGVVQGQTPDYPLTISLGTAQDITDLINLNALLKQEMRLVVNGDVE